MPLKLQGEASGEHEGRPLSITTNIRFLCLQLRYFAKETGLLMDHPNCQES